ncbi:MAG: two-component sensor histidine kinase, partial [Deltaproteobacteria bacterium]|nr:two-component sensor histidine kinase [Deltaproteobacteria bacterium]
LGNPLGSIQGFFHILRRQTLQEAERDDFFDRIESELTRMDSIIRSLLDFARPARPEAVPIDANDIVVQCLSLVEVQKWFQGLEVVTRYDPELLSVLGQADQLTQVLLNLLTNAGQAMPQGGTLTVATRTVEKGEICVSIADTGTGISPEDLKVIFDPFFTTKEPGEGTGLGLSISQAIVESMGGRIEVESRVGQGSRFSVFLPWAKKE